MTYSEEVVRLNLEINRLHAIIRERDLVITELRRDLIGTSRQLNEFAQLLGYQIRLPA